MKFLCLKLPPVVLWALKNFARNEKTSQQDFIFIADEFLDVKASNFKNK